MSEAPFQPLTTYNKYSETEMKERAAEFYREMKRRRTVREFSDQPVDRKIIEDCIRTAGTAPCGANQQAWSFVVVSDPAVKSQIREDAEKIEADFYSREATKNWCNTLKPLRTGPKKEFLDTAPYLIVIFSQQYGFDAEGEQIKHYYVKESTGISTGMLITSLHNAGLASLTYTPVNMRFLNKVLSRPDNEKAFMILVAGYPADDVQVPVLKKKSLEDIAVFI